MLAEDDKDFEAFVNQEFHLTSEYANLDEIIEFAFGEIETAIEAFKRIYQRKYENGNDYLNDDQFFGFVADEFESAKSNATIEELAEWAFGSFDEAKEAFRKKANPMNVQFIDNQEKKLGEVLLAEIRESKDTRIAVAFVSRSGLSLLKEGIVSALNQSALIEMLVGLDFMTTEPAALREMHAWSQQYTSFNFYCLVSQGSIIYHPKMYLMRNESDATVSVGSSNLTVGGLSRNAEANIVVKGHTESEIIGNAFDSYVRLKFDNRVVPDEELLDLYDQLTTKTRVESAGLPDTQDKGLVASFKRKAESLAKPIPSQRDLVGWMQLVYKSLPEGEFTNEQIYEKAELFSSHYPDNQNIVPKIRQQLQYLRDIGLVEHVSRGAWRKID